MNPQSSAAHMDLGDTTKGYVDAEIGPGEVQCGNAVEQPTMPEIEEEKEESNNYETF